MVGLGLVGQLAAQFLRASGVRTAVLDPDRGRCDLALSLGADLAPAGEAEAELSAWTRGIGLDMALVCAMGREWGPNAERGVFKTDDGGKSWRHLGLVETRHIGKVEVHPRNPDVVYVAALGILITVGLGAGGGGRVAVYVAAGSDIGRMILKKIPKKPAPSTFAACTIPSETPMKKLRKNSVVKASP